MLEIMRNWGASGQRNEGRTVTTRSMSSVALEAKSTNVLSSGSIVAGRFRLERLLGEGGMGAVWAAEHVVTNKAVALKVLKEPASPELIRRFVREARALSAVRHPNVIEVHDVVSLDSGLPAMVLDLFEGETLATHLERTRTLPVTELVALMLPIVSALRAIHGAGIVHRDLKPDNLFLARLGDGRISPMLLDFGVCKLAGSAIAMSESVRPTAAGRMMGTPSYMAPEQVRGDVDVDARADLWALGVVLYESLTGQPPFVGDTMAEVVRAIASAPVPRLEVAAPHAPAELVGIVQGLLVRDRAARVRDLAEVERALLTARDAPTPLEPSSIPGRSVITAVTVRRPRRPITLDVAPMMTSVAPPANERRSKMLRFAALAAATALVTSSLAALLVGSPAQAVSANGGRTAVSAPLPPPIATATPAKALPEPQPAPAAAAQPPTKVASKPPRPKATRPIPNYGGRR